MHSKEVPAEKLDYDVLTGVGVAAIHTEIDKFLEKVRSEELTILDKIVTHTKSGHFAVIIFYLKP